MSQTETLMLFVLGFCAALLLVLLLGRGVWSLLGRWSGWKFTRKLPIAVRDLQAERDALKAEKAMMVRKLDMGVSEMKMRMAEQMAEVSRNRNRVLDLSESLKARLAEIEGLKSQLAGRQSQVEALNLQINENVKAINAAWARAGERDADLARLVSAHKEVQAELVKREERITNLENETRALREIITIFVPGQGGNVPAAAIAEMAANGSRAVVPELVSNPFTADAAVFADRFSPTAAGNALSTLEGIMERSVTTPLSNGSLQADGEAVKPGLVPEIRSEVDRAVSNVLSLAQRFRGIQKDLKK